MRAHKAGATATHGHQDKFMHSARKSSDSMECKGARCRSRNVRSCVCHAAVALASDPVLHVLPPAFIIFDTEFTSWKGSAQRQWSGFVPGTRNREFKEIIQIAALRVELAKEWNSNKVQHPFQLHQGPTLRMLVKPTINPTLSSYVSGLTGITQQRIEKEGVEFLAGARALHDFVANASITAHDRRRRSACVPILSWGNDWIVLAGNAQALGRDLPPRIASMKSLVFDVRDVFKNAGLNITGYTSGTIHKHPALASFTDAAGHVHEAGWDARSVLMALSALIRARVKAASKLSQMLRSSARCDLQSSDHVGFALSYARPDRAVPK